MIWPYERKKYVFSVRISGCKYNYREIKGFFTLHWYGRKPSWILEAQRSRPLELREIERYKQRISKQSAGGWTGRY